MSSLHLKDQNRWDYSVKRRLDGASDRTIASELGLTYQNFRNWKYRNKHKYLTRTTVQPLQPVVQPVQQLQVTNKQFVPVNTLNMSWFDWCDYYLSKKPLTHQLDNLNSMRSGNTMYNDPRQHGKSVYCVEPYLTRICCEQQFQPFDQPALYVSSSQRNIRKMITSVRSHLMLNQRIIDDYGDLVDYSRLNRSAKTSQTMYEINLKSMRDPQLSSLYGATVDTGIRGGNVFTAIVDDSIGAKAIKDGSNLEKLTDDFMDYLKDNTEFEFRFA